MTRRAGSCADARLAADLRRAVEEAARAAQVRCVVLTGAGRGFCAGADLREAAGNAGFSYGDTLREQYNPLIRGIRAMEKPVIAAVNGVAAGAGCSLALAADLRLASDRASLVQAFVKVGLVPDAGASFFLPRLVGLSRALEMAWSGDPVSAEEALRLGLVNHVVPHDDLLSATAGLARRLAEGPTRALALIKRAFAAGLTTSLEAALEMEARLQDEASATADHREGVGAFLERRPPRFQGR